MIFQVSGSAPAMYPVELFFGLLFITEDKAKEIPYAYPIRGKWGEPVSDVFDEPEDVDWPRRIDLVYYSIVEEKFYSLEADFPIDRMKSIQESISTRYHRMRIVVGLAPYGHVAIWLYYDHCSRLIATFHGVESQVPSEQLRPLASHITPKDVSYEYYDLLPEVKENFLANGLPDMEWFNQLMTQYCYRVIPMFDVWDDEQGQWHKHEPDNSEIPMMSHVEISCSDGTFDKQHDDYLISPHQSGCPEQMNLVWHIKKSDWLMYVRFDTQMLFLTFNQIYGIHRDRCIDLLVHCDPEQRHYELALYRYGMQQPHLLPEESYQLIVFKNQFEHYRSANYAQPNGAWVW